MVRLIWKDVFYRLLWSRSLLSMMIGRSPGQPIWHPVFMATNCRSPSSRGCLSSESTRV